jgi:MFS family permease
MVLSRASAIAFVVAGAFFMENLDATVIVTALPKMASSFGVPPIDLNIGVSAYVLTLAVFIPASGWVADRLGARTVFAGAIVIFTVASVLCGVAQSLPAFTAARILQGAGGAMMVPVGRLVVLRTTAKPELLRAVATITWPGLAAPVLGPPVGGFITTYASWRWIFFLNVPLGLAALRCALRLIPNARGAAPRPFDALGFVLTGLACFGVMYGIDLMSGADAPWGQAALLLGGSLLLGAVAVWHAQRSAHPLVELWALRLRSYAVVMAGGSLFRMSIGAIPFLLPLMLQLGFGLDPFASGLLVLAVFAGNLAMKPLTTPVLRRFGFRRTLIGNGLITAAATFGCALLEPTTPVTLSTLAFADVPSARMGGANTLFNMAQQMGFGMGIAIGAVSLRLAGIVHEHHAAVPAVDDFHLAFVLVGGLALLGVADVIRLPADAGAEVSGARAQRQEPKRT